MIKSFIRVFCPLTFIHDDFLQQNHNPHYTE